MLEFGGMQKSSLPSLHGPRWAAAVAPDRVLLTCQIELLDIQTESKHMT